MRKKIKMNLGGIPPNVGNLFNIASYLQGQKSLPGSGEGLDMLTGPDNAVFSQAPLGAPSGLTPLGPSPVVSSAYNVTSPQLQAPSNVPQQTLNQIGPLDELNPFGKQRFFPGSFEADQMMMQGLNFADQKMAMPQNEFDQAQEVITKAKKAGNVIKRGRDAVQHARNVKKAADVASAAGGDVGSLLSNLGSQGAGAVAKEGAKSGVGQLIANAGASKFGTFLSSGAGAAASAGVGILGKAIQELDKKDGNYSRAGAMGGGALQGAAIGSALGPIGTVAGAAIGAGIGAMQRKKFEQNAINEELTKKTDTAVAEAKNRLAGRSILKSFPVEGIKEQVYAYGGHTNDPDYLAEGGEMIQHAPGDLPKTDNNGSVTPVTKTIARINGDKHIAASGGVGMEGKEPARIYSDQLTVPKELVKQLSRL